MCPQPCSLVEHSLQNRMQTMVKRFKRSLRRTKKKIIARKSKLRKPKVETPVLKKLLCKRHRGMRAVMGRGKKGYLLECGCTRELLRFGKGRSLRKP